MKDLATNHIAIKQSIIGGLVNTSDLPSDAKVKVGLLNNALVFPVPYSFDFNDFSKSLFSYINDTLKTSAVEAQHGDDIKSVTFSPIGLGLMKKAVVYSLLDYHLYINILPAKEIENPNYTEGKISEIISSGKTDKIYQFAEDYVMALYPPAVAEMVRPQGRYFFSTSPGVAPIIASHLEENELLLAKLDIYRIDASKSNAQTADMGMAFYISTTLGSYLFVLDKNNQEKYIETLSDAPMTVKAKIGRDPVTCGRTKWLTMRDNDFLFDEVSAANMLPPQEKLFTFSQLHFNMGETIADKEYASHLINMVAGSEGSTFAKFAAKMVDFSVALEQKPDAMDSKLAMELMECADALFSEEGCEKKISELVTRFNFDSQELMALIFIISRVKNRHDDTSLFVEMMLSVKDKFFAVDADTLDRAFVCVSMSKKFNLMDERKAAGKVAKEALDLCGDMSAITLAPGLDTMPNMPYSGPALRYAALEEMFAAAETDKERYGVALEMAILKPLIESNLANAIKYSEVDATKVKLQAAMSMFDVERYNNYSYTTTNALEGTFSKIRSSSFMPAYTRWRKAYSGFSSWVDKVTPDKSISSVKSYGELVDTNNYHLLYEFDESLTKYFETDVDVYVLSNRNQGIVSNDDGECKYIIIDSELLDTDNPNYMNGSELLFAMAREFASLRIGLSRLTCHPQWRNYSVNGVHSLDVISLFAPEPSFIASDVARYTRLLCFGKLMSLEGYFDFDVNDTTTAIELLGKTLDTLRFAGNRPDNLKETEYAALSQLSATVADRAGLVVSGNIVTSIKAMIHNENQLMGVNDFCTDGAVGDLACARGNDGRPINYDFAMRLNALLSFYISDDYKLE